MSINVLTQRGDQVSYRPEHRKQSQKVPGRLWKEFKEQSSIDGQIATNSESNACIERTSADPGGGTASSKTKNTGEKEGEVESEAASDNIRCHAPERRSYTKAKEERKSCVSDFGFADTKFGGKLGQC
jgi:hypothetical protein